MAGRVCPGSRPGASWPSELRPGRVGRAAAWGGAIGLRGWRAPARVQLRHGERRLPDGILHHGQRRRGGGCQGALCAAAGDPRRARTTRTRRDARLPPHCRQSSLARLLSPPRTDFSHLQPGRGALSRACCRLSPRPGALEPGHEVVQRPLPAGPQQSAARRALPPPSSVGAPRPSWPSITAPERPAVQRSAPAAPAT